MSLAVKFLELSFSRTPFQCQALMITLLNYYKETVSPQCSLPDLPQNTIPFTEIDNSLHGFNTCQNDEVETQEAFASAPSTVKTESKLCKKLKLAKISFQSPQN